DARWTAEHGSGIGLLTRRIQVIGYPQARSFAPRSALVWFLCRSKLGLVRVEGASGASGLSARTVGDFCPYPSHQSADRESIGRASPLMTDEMLQASVR